MNSSVNELNSVCPDVLGIILDEASTNALDAIRLKATCKTFNRLVPKPKRINLELAKIDQQTQIANEMDTRLLTICSDMKKKLIDPNVKLPKHDFRLMFNILFYENAVILGDVVILVTYDSSNNNVHVGWGMNDSFPDIYESKEDFERSLVSIGRQFEFPLNVRDMLFLPIVHASSFEITVRLSTDGLYSICQIDPLSSKVTTLPRFDDDFWVMGRIQTLDKKVPSRIFISERMKLLKRFQNLAALATTLAPYLKGNNQIGMGVIGMTKEAFVLTAADDFNGGSKLVGSSTVQVVVLGRRRNIVKKGRIAYCKYKGELCKLSELRKLEKKQ